MKSRITLLSSLFALILGLVVIPTAAAQSGNAKVRVIHASPDAPAVDVYVNGTRTLTNVPFFTISDYLDVPAGTYRFQVTPTGAALSSAVIDAEATLEAGKAYTVAATGPVASIKPTVIVDSLSAPAAGKAKVRVYHFSPDAPAVDVKLKGGATLIPGLAFANNSDYLEVDAGSYDLVVTPAGSNTTVIDLSGTTLEAGKLYEVFATNVVASITPELKVTTLSSTTAAPNRLPTTSTGDAAPLALLIGVGLAMLGTGALLLRRRALR